MPAGTTLNCRLVYVLQLNSKEIKNLIQDQPLDYLINSTLFCVRHSSFGIILWRLSSSFDLYDKNGVEKVPILIWLQKKSLGVLLLKRFHERFLKIQREPLALESLSLMKVQIKSLACIEKRLGRFPVNFVNFSRTFFNRTPAGDCSCNFKQPSKSL